IADLVYGQPDFTTTGANYHDTLNGQISEQGLSSPKKLKLDTSRRMWVVDSSNRRILNFEDIAANTANTLPALVLGQANFSQGYNNRLEAEALVTPRGLVLTSGSTISAYIVDEATHRILVFDDVQSLKDGEAPSRVLGQPNDLSYTKNAGADLTSISGSGLDTPSHIAWDNTNSVLYVTDKNHKRILAYQSLGSGTLTATSVFGAPNMGAAGTLYSFGALAVYDTTLYAAAGNRIFVYNTTQASEDPEKVFGQPYPYTPPLEIGEVISNTCNHGGIGADSLCEVQGLAVDEDGTLWVADTGNDRVLWFDNPTDSDLLAARTADGVVGQPDFVSNGDHAGTGSNRRYGFKDVRGIALNTLPGTNEQQLWAVDTSNHRVLRFSNPKDHALNTELQQADLVLGQADLSSYDSNGGTGVSEYGFYSPQYISIDEHAKVLLVSDTGNHRVMRFILNDAPVLTGGGTFDIVEGDSAVVELSASDPNGDTLDFALLDPVALGGTLSSLTLSFVSDGYKAGDTVSFTVVATDQNTNPKSASASVVFNIISRPQEVTEGTPPAARPDVRTEASCNCSGMGGISLLPWLLIAWFGRFSLRRRR
ncbi:NHL repeat-containing protein, partial [Myxococcota bacterium]|nr:NHL repeat-containing protein [Myxococcota bacterium]